MDDGNRQVLGHMLVSPGLLLHFRGGEIPHLNARYPAVLRDDPTTARRASDHDPLVAWFVLR